jgi:hypothetical protein
VRSQTATTVTETLSGTLASIGPDTLLTLIARSALG